MTKLGKSIKDILDNDSLSDSFVLSLGIRHYGLSEIPFRPSLLRYGFAINSMRKALLDSLKEDND